jgi:hypothetical protein
MMQMHTFVRHGIHSVAALLLFAASVHAQSPVPRPVTPISLSGPRVGATFLSGGITDKLSDNYIEVAPVVSQFGWQFEKRFKTGANGLAAVSEWVLLAGGLEQGVLLPSVSWLVGLRTGSGFEFGVGPNASPAGVALAGAVGVTLTKGSLNVPINVAVVPSKSGVRISLLTGFNMRN